MAAKLVHAMVRVREEARSLAFYAQAFGLEVADRYDFPDFSLIYLSNAETGFELELTVNKDRADPYVLGDGYGHLAVTVEALDQEHARLEGAGLSPGPVRDFRHEGRTLARFFFIADPDGYKIEVIERGGRFK